jgi:hypothetical protein
MAHQQPRPAPRRTTMTHSRTELAFGLLLALACFVLAVAATVV